MADVAASDAKIHFLKLLARVEEGERFVITRYGKPVAELTPVAARDTAAIARDRGHSRRPPAPGTARRAAA